MTIGSCYYYHYWSTKQHQYFSVAGVGLSWYSQIDNHYNLQTVQNYWWISWQQLYAIKYDVDICYLLTEIWSCLNLPCTNGANTLPLLCYIQKRTSPNGWSDWLFHFHCSVRTLLKSEQIFSSVYKVSKPMLYTLQLYKLTNRQNRVDLIQTTVFKAAILCYNWGLKWMQLWS